MSNKTLTSLEKVLNYSIYYEDIYGFSHFENGLMTDYADLIRRVNDIKDDPFYAFCSATGTYNGKRIVLNF